MCPKTNRPARAGRFVVVLVAAFVLCGLSSAAAADGYAAAPWQLYRDTNPFVAASGLPFAPPAAAPDSWGVETVLAASNTELAFDRGTEHLLYDNEVHEVRVALTRAFGERWLLRATLGGETFSNGFLDSFIQDFHRAFGFSNGDRGHLGSDGHTIDYDGGGSDRITLDRNVRAITPLLIDLALRTPADGHEWLAGATLKVPTSHASPLVDDRATDLSLWLAAQSTAPQTRLPWGARIGVMQRGDTRLLPQRARSKIPFADATIGYILLPGWDVAAQLQWHGGLYDTAIPFLESAATLTLSSAWHARAGWTLRAGFVEDAIPRHAQDVTFFLGISI
ncbi:MAG: DUF3187 family protein [Dokdonella sp.]